MLNWIVPSERNNYKPYLLRNVALVAYTIILLLVNTFGGLLGISQAQASSITKDNLIQLTNQERQKYGMPSLTENARLNSAALAKANNMFQLQYWDHFGPNGETPWQFIKGSGYSYVYAGENLAKGFKSSEGVVQAWMASPTHRDNILSGNYREIGIATLDGVLNGEQVTLVVQMFGNATSNTISPPSVPPTPAPIITPDEKGEIKSIKITYPEDGSTLTSPSFTIKGEVDGVADQEDYTVEVQDEEVVVGNLTTNAKKWEFTRLSDWPEGEHEITATLVEEDDVKDSVKFLLDSTPPKITDEDIIVEELEDGWKVTVKVEEENAEVVIVVGSRLYPARLNDEGNYVVTIDGVRNTDKIRALISDEHGNTVDVDITDRFNLDDGAVLGGFLGNVNIKDGLNVVFVIFIFILLLIEIVVYARKGMIKERAGSMLSMMMWWMLLLVGTLNGFGGSIL